MLDFGPTFSAQGELSQGLAINQGLRSKYSHLLAVATVGISTRNLILLYTKLLSQLLLQTSRVESGQ